MASLFFSLLLFISLKSVKFGTVLFLPCFLCIFVAVQLATDAEIKAASQKVPTVPEIQYVTLNNLSWEQDSERVKVYSPLKPLSLIILKC